MNAQEKRDFVALKACYDGLRDFMFGQQWEDGHNGDQCPWCGAHEGFGRHNEGCYFEEVEKRTRY